MLASGHIDSITAFISATYESLKPKSVSKVIIGLKTIDVIIKRFEVSLNKGDVEDVEYAKNE
jgi:hypothetical protein